jgi:hypothetical protein
MIRLIHPDRAKRGAINLHRAAPKNQQKAKESASFLKKRSKKLLITAGLGAVIATIHSQKSFLVPLPAEGFFQKRTACLPFKACGAERKPA